MTLTTPWGVVVELHPKNEGGNADDLKVTYDETSLPALSTLRGRGTQGAWRLAVQDLAPADVGRLNRWSLEFALGGRQVRRSRCCSRSRRASMIPDASAAGIERTLTTAECGQVVSVEVGVDISHTYIGDLRVRLRSPAGTEAVLHDRSGGAGDNIARTYTAATTPTLAALVGKPVAGTLDAGLVSDHEAVDVGKLNRWSLTLRRA